MTDLLQLAERCEQAAGPDYALGREILFACGWTEREYNEIGEEPGTVMAAPDGTVPQHYPQPTHSLDAAMTLVPEGWHVGGLYDQFHTRKWHASVAQLPSADQLRSFDAGKTFGVECEHAEAATAALALCAAALKARAASGRDAHRQFHRLQPMTDNSIKGPIVCGQFYVNGRGDVLGPMQQTFTESGEVLNAAGLTPEASRWVHDQYGTQYDARTGQQYGHLPASTGNIVREATSEEVAQVRP